MRNWSPNPSNPFRGSPSLLRAAALLTLLLLASAACARAESKPLEELRPLQDVFVRVAESVMPAVVYIRTEGTLRHPLVTRRPGEPAPPLDDIPRRGFGSGVIFDPRGYILTNHHVIDGSERIYVTLADGREMTGELVGADKRSDLAVIRIRADRPLSAVQFGDSDRLRVGQWAIAIGHPYGLERSVTVGVISGVGRNGMGITHYEDFIQTDASIHPGNSGGPLLNAAGEVIGLNTAIVSRTGGGIGFAIPVNMARQIAQTLIRDGKVVRGFLGVMIQEVSPEMAPKFSLERPEGALIADVVEGGASDKAGVRRGDVVLEFGGRPVRDVPALQRLAAAAPPGSRVVLTVQRDGRRVPVPVVMEGLRESDEEPSRPKPKPQKPSYGLTVGRLTLEMTRVVARRGVTGGIQVTAVAAGSQAAFDGLRVGDVIAEVEHRPVADEESFGKTLAARPDAVLVLLYRAGQSMYRILHPSR
ncbi:MAG: Do family serine endopeptidase [Candidatus Tectomicrobia bacterium]|nr:Do family serine endopeptidase [Candidatus Tectomicrobia bacterium]